MLITADEVSVQTGTVYTGSELDKVNSFISNVSDSIEAFCRRTFPSPAPGAIKAVALIEVRRLLNSEPGVATERVADLASGYAYGGAAVVLSSASEDSLRAYLRWVSPRYGSIRLVTPTYVSALPVPIVTVPSVVQGPTDLTITGRTWREGLVQVQHSLDGVTWVDSAVAESQDISDGGLPYWHTSFPIPAGMAVYGWRARLRFDNDTSRWSRAVQTEVT
ncbi:hypothetical protein [Actinomadura oligospora]|uniref:hypothetical protein n=1 Tax=Actinomadura oligospora TaxID=111804 RepID=UPI000478C018|nr:hypothetical protein [Actinomadura oligospora]